MRDIAKLYPNFNIDAKTEQEALLNADRIIFQYPIYWYNIPPVLKQWFDQVLTYGFTSDEGVSLAKEQTKKVIEILNN